MTIERGRPSPARECWPKIHRRPQRARATLQRSVQLAAQKQIQRGSSMPKHDLTLVLNGVGWHAGVNLASSRTLGRKQRAAKRRDHHLDGPIGQERRGFRCAGRVGAERA